MSPRSVTRLKGVHATYALYFRSVGLEECPVRKSELTLAPPYSVAWPSVKAVLTAGEGLCACILKVSRHAAASPSQRLGILVEPLLSGYLLLPRR